MTAPTVADQARDLANTHLHLIDHVIARYRRVLHPGYDRDDAWQDGWIALVDAATRYDPTRGTFPGFARHRVRGAILHAVRSSHGSSRRHRLNAVSLDRTHTDGTPVIELPDTGPSVERQAHARLDLERAIAVARAEVDDWLDLHVLAWMLDLTDDRTQADLAHDLGVHAQRIWTRRNRLINATETR